MKANKIALKAANAVTRLQMLAEQLEKERDEWKDKALCWKAIAEDSHDPAKAQSKRVR